MMFKIKKGFSLIELIVVVTALSIISGMIYNELSFIQDMERKSNIVKDMELTKKVIEERLKNTAILEGTLVSGKKIFYDNQEILNKNEFTSLNDTKEKRDFFGVDKNQNKKYIYAQQKYISTVNGEIPYIDLYLVYIGPKFDRIYKDNFDKLNELFLVQDGVGLTPRLNDEFESSPSEKEVNGKIVFNGYPYFQKKSSMTEAEFRKEAKNVVFIKLSTQDIVLDKVNSSIEIVKNYSKNLKDWGSIQMSMYENVIAKYGGSFNIGYFVSLGINSNTLNASETEVFNTQMLFSSQALDSSNDNSRITSGTKQGFNNISSTKKFNTTSGIVICKNDCDDKNSLSNSEIVSLHNYQEYVDKLPNDAEIIISNAISLDSKKLMPGSKMIFGINNDGKSINNAFGEKYKIYFTNHKTWDIEWTNILGDSGFYLNYSQNVPVINSFAPYSATIFTIFPWMLDDEKTPETMANGYFDVKVFPELR